MASSGGSEQQWLPSINVTGVGNLGNFDQFSGGDATATPIKYRPGGMGPETTYQSLPTFSDVTLSRVYEESRDHVLIGQLHFLAGRALCTVSLQPLDDDGNPFGTPRTYSGRLASVNDGNTDSTSSSARKWSIMMSVETPAN